MATRWQRFSSVHQRSAQSRSGMTGCTARRTRGSTPEMSRAIEGRARLHAGGIRRSVKAKATAQAFLGGGSRFSCLVVSLGELALLLLHERVGQARGRIYRLGAAGRGVTFALVEESRALEPCLERH